MVEANKRLYLIRHAKSSWADLSLDDFDRPLNKRGKRNGPVMAKRLAAKDIRPDTIVSSPARRARRTAVFMAKGCGFRKKDIRYEDRLYLGSLTDHLALIDAMFREVDAFFLVGHNHTITELAEYLTGDYLGNMPTCGVVGIEYPKEKGFSPEAGQGRLLFFDYPKNKVDDVI